MTPIDEFLKTLAPDEPVFCLRAQDRTAPDIVEAWANAVEFRAQADNPDGVRLHNRRHKIKEARALAHQMRAWQELNGCKVPD